MLRKLWRRCVNYETVSYLICGILTTLVDWGVFGFLNESTGMDYRIATAISWFAAVLFAYGSNKLVVFRNYRFQPAYLWREWWSFFGARVFSGLVTMILMIFLVDTLGWGSLLIGVFEAGLYLAKAVVSAVNLVVNYIFSKLWIFKRNDRV